MPSHISKLTSSCSFGAESLDTLEIMVITANLMPLFGSQPINMEALFRGGHFLKLIQVRNFGIERVVYLLRMERTPYRTRTNFAAYGS